MTPPDARALIVVVEDEPSQRQVLVEYLSRQQLRVVGAESAAALREALAREMPALVLLDVGLPDEDGFSLARNLREKHPALGIIMVTAASDTVDRVVGLETGADDYVAKPFEPRELLARVRSLLRRQQTPSPSPPVAAAAAPAQPVKDPEQVPMGRCVLDLRRRALIEADGRLVALTASEFDLLAVFVKHPNRPLTREWLLEVTSHRESDAFDRAIDLRITRIRRKVEHDPEHPQAIRTVRGVGYMYCPTQAG